MMVRNSNNLQLFFNFQPLIDSSKLHIYSLWNYALAILFSLPLLSRLWNTDELFPHMDIRIFTMFSIPTVTIFAQLKFRAHGLMPEQSTGNMHCPSKSRIYGSCMDITIFEFWLCSKASQNSACHVEGTQHCICLNGSEVGFIWQKPLESDFSYGVWEILVGNNKFTSPCCSL